MAFPEQNNTDMRDPSQRFVWMFRGIGFRGMPFTAPQEVFEEWSQHISECGGLHISQVEEALNGVVDDAVKRKILRSLPRQEIHFQPPVRGQQHYMNQTGKWVPVEEPLQAPQVDVIDSLTVQEKAELVSRFREEGLVD